MNEKNKLPTMYWQDNRLCILDQRFLPLKVEYRSCKNCSQIIDSIKEMSVRGAPAIGITAAYGMAIAALNALEEGYNKDKLLTSLDEAASNLIMARPTAVNLFWAVQRMKNLIQKQKESSPQQIFESLLTEAKKIHDEDVNNNRMIGYYGSELVPEKASVLTHCNAGALATCGYGTALGVVRAAVKQGKDIHVFVDETRPLLQGSRITAFELLNEDISATLVTDSAAGSLLSGNKVDLILVGADRIAANGDVANKIGTYTLAVLADYHNVPFYVAAPVSTIDMTVESGESIIIEKRCSSEITYLDGHLTAPEGITAFNPAFDITPAKLITAIITERGVVCRPDREKLNKLF